MITDLAMHAVKVIMYGYGDAEQPLPATVDLVEVFSDALLLAVNAKHVCATEHQLLSP